MAASGRFLLRVHVPTDPSLNLPDNRNVTAGLPAARSNAEIDIGLRPTPTLS
jgi:hypothetical protein